jgi:hypothetical protein
VNALLIFAFDDFAIGGAGKVGSEFGSVPLFNEDRFDIRCRGAGDDGGDMLGDDEGGAGLAVVEPALAGEAVGYSGWSAGCGDLGQGASTSPVSLRRSCP